MIGASMLKKNKSSTEFSLRSFCHVNSNDNDDRFVGIKIEKDTVNIFFPIGYDLPSNETELRRDIKNLIKLISNFTDKEERIMALDSLDPSQLVSIPIQAYFYLLNHFIKNNRQYYIEKESAYKKDTRGKVNWEKTIKHQHPFFQNGSFLYLKQIVRFSKFDQNRLITQIHKFLVLESYEHLGWLFSLNKPEPSNIVFDKKLFLSTVNLKLKKTNNDEDKKLFLAMKAIIECCGNNTDEKKLFFGTNNFETIWEKLINKFFGIPNKDSFFPHAIWKERYGNNNKKRSSALEPDTIMLFNNNIYVLDAKYYRYATKKTLSAVYLPQSADINKQITYGEYVNNHKPTNGKVYNAFILPYNKNNNQFDSDKNFLNIAEAIGDWLENRFPLKTYERIQAIVVDTRYILNNYEGLHYSDKKSLTNEIEYYFN